jgi:transposase
VTRYLKELGASFRRARRVPARKTDPWRQQVFQRALKKVRRLASCGACDLFFGDESGFSLVAPLPYLWQSKGKTVAFPAQGHQKRLNVLGFWKEEAQETQSLIYRTEYGTMTAQHFVALVEEELLPSLRRPAVLVVDNARLHRCALVASKLETWKAQGLRLWFLPPYSPHLNRIERLWKHIKYHWIEPQAYTDFATLSLKVCCILSLVGKKYSLSFG